MHNAMIKTFILGGLAAALVAVTPIVPANAAPAEDDSLSSIIHTVKSGDTLMRIASSHRREAGWYGTPDCLTAIRATNGLEGRDLLNIGQTIIIPRHVEHERVMAAQPTTDGSNLRGLYLPGPVCGYQSVFGKVDRFTAAGGNGVVFDAKDIDGAVSFRSTQDLAVYGKGRPAPWIPDLNQLVNRLQTRDLWVVARLALFLDGELGKQRPDLALQDGEGEVWAERAGIWMDPAAAEVRDYNLALAVELANAGVDEIQVDYVRFPTNGWTGDWQGDLESTATRRREIVTSFVATLHDTLQALDCKLSADLFGIMAWGRTADLALTGQHVPSLAPHLDIICPMIYPSHFGPGFEGLDNPGDHPEYVIAEGVRRFQKQAGPELLIRPWLQAFPWRVSNYDADYVAAQVNACDTSGASGWCLWNPAGRYEVAQAGIGRTPALPVIVMNQPALPEVEVVTVAPISTPVSAPVPVSQPMLILADVSSDNRHPLPLLPPPPVPTP